MLARMRRSSTGLGPGVNLKYQELQLMSARDLHRECQKLIHCAVATTCQQVLEGGAKKELAWLRSHGKHDYHSTENIARCSTTKESIQKNIPVVLRTFSKLFRTLCLLKQHLKQWVESSEAGVSNQFVAALSINELLVAYPLHPNNVTEKSATGRRLRTVTSARCLPMF